MAKYFTFGLVDPHQLAVIIRNRIDNVLILDSRSFLEYNSSHIINAINVGCAKLMKRRLQQDKLSIKDFLAHSCHWDVDTNTDIIVYDQSTEDPNYLPPDGFMSVFLHKLLPVYKSVNVLKGGYLAFNACYPNLCENDKTKFTPLTSLSQPCLPISDHGPTRILSFLYLGSQHDALNKEVLLNHSITYELNVSTNCPKPDFIQEAHFVRIPVIDNYSEKLLPYFPQAFQFLDKVRESGGCALVHCLAGISRSATIAIAYVMKHLKMSSDEAYRYVKSKRTTISPNFNFLGQLLEYENQLQLEKVLSPKCKTVVNSPPECVFTFDHTKLSKVPPNVQSPSGLQDITFNSCSNGTKSTNGYYASEKQANCRSSFELCLKPDRGHAKPDEWGIKCMPVMSLKELNFTPCQASEKSTTLKSLNIVKETNLWCQSKNAVDMDKLSVCPQGVAQSDPPLFNDILNNCKLESYNGLNLWPSKCPTSLSLSQVTLDSKDYNRSDSTSTSGLGSEGSDLTDSWNEYHSSCERETDSLMDEECCAVPTDDDDYQRRMLNLDEASLYPNSIFRSSGAGIVPSKEKFHGFSMARCTNSFGKPANHHYPWSNRSSGFHHSQDDDHMVDRAAATSDLKSPKYDGLYRVRSCPRILSYDCSPQQSSDHSVVPTTALRTRRSKSKRPGNQNRYSCSSLDYMEYSSQTAQLKAWPGGTTNTNTVSHEIFRHGMIQVS